MVTEVRQAERELCNWRGLVSGAGPINRWTNCYLLLLTEPLLIFWSGGYSLLTNMLQKLLFCGSCKGPAIVFCSKCCQLLNCGCVFGWVWFSGLAFAFGRITPNENLTSGAARAAFKGQIKCGMSNVRAVVLLTVTLIFPLYFIAKMAFQFPNTWGHDYFNWLIELIGTSANSQCTFFLGMGSYNGSMWHECYC